MLLIFFPSFSAVVHKDQYSFNSHTCVKWHNDCIAWYPRLEASPEVRCKSDSTSFVLGHTHAAFPFCAEEEINLPTEGNCAHANCFEKPSLTLYGAISSDSLFGNRQTLTLILELWHCGVQKSCSFQFSGLVFRVSSAATAAVSVGGGAGFFCSHCWDEKEQLTATHLRDVVRVSRRLQKPWNDLKRSFLVCEWTAL